MKKQIVLLFLSLVYGMAFAQTDVIRTKANALSSGASNFNKQAVVDANLKAYLNLSIPRAATFTLNNAKDTAGYIMYNTTIQKMGVYRGGGQWDTISTSNDALITGGPISSVPTVGFNPGTSISVADFIQNSFYQSQPPTAGLTGGFTLELNSPGSFVTTLNWTAGRQSATAPIATINVAGVNQTFAQPAQGGNVSGTRSVSVTYNTNTTFTNLVTTTDGKAASATTTYTFLPKFYAGRTTNVNATSADLLSSAGGANGLTSIRNRTVTITASGSNRVFYAYPSSFGSLTSINIGGLESLSAFNLTVISFTNASGFTQNYNIYTSINQTSGDATLVTN